MKTLLMAPELFRSEGGISRIMRLYLQALCELAGPADRIAYVALNDLGNEEVRMEGSARARLSRRTGCNRSKLRFIREALGQGLSADRIICAHLHHLPVAWLARRLFRKARYCLVAHGIEVWRPYSLIERLSLQGAERILCVSEYTRRQMMRFDSRLKPERLVVVPNTFDPRFQPAASDTVTVAPFRRPRILVVSRLVASDPYKGVDLVIESMPAVLREFPQAQLRIVGGGDDIPRLEGLVRTLGLDAAVRFTGVVDDGALAREYELCDIFALPSRKEGFGLVYLEAMSYGKPCLAARAGGAPEVVTEETGAVVEYGNTDQIALAVADLMRHPRDPAAMRRRAEEFSFPRFKERLAGLMTT